MTPTVLIEAPPGAGKTTALTRVADLLRDSRVTIAGFTTEEVREHGRRVGFAIEALDSGARSTLAHVDLPGPPRVGRYGVDLEAFERLALPALRVRARAVLIDEIGKMELASAAFRTAASELLASGAIIAATIQRSRHPFTDALKERPDSELVRLTRQNRDRVPEQVVSRLLKWLSGAA